jgi:hypothetical protein
MAFVVRPLLKRRAGNRSRFRVLLCGRSTFDERTFTRYTWQSLRGLCSKGGRLITVCIDYGRSTLNNGLLLGTPGNLCGASAQKEGRRLLHLDMYPAASVLCANAPHCTVWRVCSKETPYLIHHALHLAPLPKRRYLCTIQDALHRVWRLCCKEKGPLLDRHGNYVAWQLCDMAVMWHASYVAWQLCGMCQLMAGS